MDHTAEEPVQVPEPVDEPESVPTSTAPVVQAEEPTPTVPVIESLPLPKPPVDSLKVAEFQRKIEDALRAKSVKRLTELIFQIRSQHLDSDVSNFSAAVAFVSEQDLF